MSEEAFWLGVWKIVGAAFMVLTVTIGSCSSYTNYKIAEVVKGGADPVAAACAFSNADHNGMCAAIGAIRATKDYGA